jgi:hypothetical protein
VTRRGTCRCAPAEGHAYPLSVRRDDELAYQRAGRNVKNNDPSLVEPIAAQ